MDHISRLSEVLYVGLCYKIGTPTEVVIRRDVRDIKDMIMKPFTNYKGFVMMDSGSHREGFRLRSSDMDRMVWSSKYTLIDDISQSRFYNASKCMVVLMEDYDTPPGFVRLRLLTPTRHINLISCLVLSNDRVYISSGLWREIHFQLQQEQCAIFPWVVKLQSLRIHGPCNTGCYELFEFDVAYCLAIIHRSKQLGSWVDRCQRHTWPPLPVLEKILKSESHCVPIGSKVDTISNELEWRLSFSLAEQQLVCSMNHTQFLCYGLLKIFLKEVINCWEDNLLCSYYMKTTMFWLIQLGQVRWCSNNLLVCFWRCFRYLIHCVYRGVFPNFFIPENNMFFNKVIGVARESLLQQLYQYYRMGVSCLLLSPTLRSILAPALSSPFFVLSPAEGEFISIIDLDTCYITEIFQLGLFARSKLESYLYLQSINTLSRLSISPYQLLLLQYCTAHTLVRSAFMKANDASNYTHKNIYNLDTIICGMLKMAAKLGTVCHSLYLALYYYRTGRYAKTVRITHLAKQRLSQSFIIYCFFDRQRYNEAVGHLSLSRRMKIAWVNDMRLFVNIPCIEELALEQHASQKNGNLFLSLSPFIIVEMLSVLSHYRLGNRSQCLQSLTDLQTLLLHDDETYVPLHARDISWQILGICQHVVGDLHGALESYEESLRQEPCLTQKIKEATDFRIECVKQQLQRNTPM